MLTSNSYRMLITAALFLAGVGSYYTMRLFWELGGYSRLVFDLFFIDGIYAATVVIVTFLALAIAYYGRYYGPRRQWVVAILFLIVGSFILGTTLFSWMPY